MVKKKKNVLEGCWLNRHLIDYIPDFGFVVEPFRTVRVQNANIVYRSIDGRFATKKVTG